MCGDRSLAHDDLAHSRVEVVRVMRVKKIQRAIEKGRITTFMANDPTPATKDRVLKELKLFDHSLRFAQRFILDAGDISQKEVAASCEAMYEMDLFRLPYGIIYTEMSVAMETRESGKRLSSRVCLLTAELDDVGRRAVEDPFAPACFMTRAMINFSEIDGQNVYRFFPGVFISGPTGFVQFTSFKDVEVDKTTQEYFLSCGDAFGKCLQTLIVLLETKGVEKEFIETHKTKLISRDTPVNGYTIVRNYRSKTSSGRIIEERKRVRLHLRRGHIRRQRWGRGNKWEKKIWIEPTLVGYEEEGRIEHDYEVDKI